MMMTIRQDEGKTARMRTIEAILLEDQVVEIPTVMVMEVMMGTVEMTQVEEKYLERKTPKILVLTTTSQEEDGEMTEP